MLTFAVFIAFTVFFNCSYLFTSTCRCIALWATVTVLFLKCILNKFGLDGIKCEKILISYSVHKFIINKKICAERIMGSGAKTELVLKWEGGKEGDVYKL